MTWAAFSSRRTAAAVRIHGMMDSVKYIKTLEPGLFPFVAEKRYNQYTFQQDNAAIYTWNVTKNFFFNHGIMVLQWPSLRPDLNPMEKLWGMLVRMVYAGLKQCDDYSTLVNAIADAWDKISREQLRTLVDSMPSRMGAVLACNGSHHLLIMRNTDGVVSINKCVLRNFARN